jgi:hypothetical protein
MAKLDATTLKPQNRYRVKNMTQIHVVVIIICSIAIFMLGLIDVLSMIYAQIQPVLQATQLRQKVILPILQVLPLMQLLLLYHHRHALQKIPPS